MMVNKILKNFLVITLAIFSTSLFATSKGNHHFPGLFIGATNTNNETNFSYGLEYEYKFTRSWGAGLVLEYTDDAHEKAGTKVQLASAYFHPLHHLRLGLGFGKEIINGIDGHSDHQESLVRMSVNYDFIVGDFEISPTLAFDFIDGETSTVLGAAFIIPF